MNPLEIDSFLLILLLCSLEYPEIAKLLEESTFSGVREVLCSCLWDEKNECLGYKNEEWVGKCVRSLQTYVAVLRSEEYNDVCMCNMY